MNTKREVKDTLKLHWQDRHMRCEACHTMGRCQSLLIWIGVFLILVNVSGCSPQIPASDDVDYTPLVSEDWKVSTPEEQGLDAHLVADLYRKAEEHPTLHGLLIVKNIFLIAERYFIGKKVDSKAVLASVTKRFISAFVGIALDDLLLLNDGTGRLAALDQQLGIRTAPRSRWAM